MALPFFDRYVSSVRCQDKSHSLDFACCEALLARGPPRRLSLTFLQFPTHWLHEFNDLPQICGPGRGRKDRARSGARGVAAPACSARSAAPRASAGAQIVLARLAVRRARARTRADQGPL